MGPLYILWQALRHINKTKSPPPIVSGEYVKALVTLGFITNDWDTYLTKEGQEMLTHLENKFY